MFCCRFLVGSEYKYKLSQLFTVHAKGVFIKFNLPMIQTYEKGWAFVTLWRMMLGPLVHNNCHQRRK